MHIAITKDITIDIPKAGLLVALMHLAGAIGMATPLRDVFLLLTPLHLMATAALLLFHQERWTMRFIWFIVAVTVMTFFTEVAGVLTGFVFGAYDYGRILGLKLLGTPLLIGVLWFVLIYATISTMHRLKWSSSLKALIAGLIMVVMDVFIEPVAIALDFWQWEGDAIPLQNYVAWFVISFIIARVAFALNIPTSNKLAPYVLGAQFAFFVILGILL